MSKLFESTDLNGLKLENRFVRSGTWMALAEETGEMTPELLAKYTELAEANIGMVICGYARVDQDERANNRMIGMFSDEVASTYKNLIKVFKANNTPVGIQLAMGGTQVHYQGDVTWPIYAPSPTEMTRQDASGNEVTYKVKEMSKEEIKNVIEKFADAALHVKELGFDLVQIHAGHGYFLSQWMNPSLNVREDEYGQDRGLFVKELYKAIRVAVGSDMKVAIKLNSEEEIGNHDNFDSMLKLCTELDNMGIDLIEVSGCAPSRNKRQGESYFSDFTTKLANLVNCKTMITGGNRTFKGLEQLVETSKVDYIGLSRPLISEPNLIKKWQVDQDYKSRCISCNYCHRQVYTCVFDK